MNKDKTIIGLIIAVMLLVVLVLAEENKIEGLVEENEKYKEIINNEF